MISLVRWQVCSAQPEEERSESSFGGGLEGKENVEKMRLGLVVGWV